MLLAAESATRIRSEDPHLGERDVEELRQRLLQLERVLDRAPHVQPVVDRFGDEAMRLDGEVGDHRELVLPLDHVVGVVFDRGNVAPAEVDLGLDVGVRERLTGPERRILHERRVGIQRGVDGVDLRQHLVLDHHESGGLLGGLLRIGGHSGDRLTVVVDDSGGEHRTVLILGSESRHRLGEIVRGQNQPDTRDLLRLGGVDRDDPSPRLVDLDELRVQLAHEVDVGDVLLGAGDTIPAADPIW